ncbi:IPT/TIG domain-containing protein [Roseateles sp. SL47]|uniref:IPT/TIG domain-containing protein n=1 Tax=Roseateles sp. SL47 TaxID=2995138 RepID=UPI0022720422|nr:IPT/TIG domain-containing protein [Roseateles sp. SL47]WAC71437.1 IPT/TIG domain-containing protein [Roseateles sp. SL47]
MLFTERLRAAMGAWMGAWMGALAAFVMLMAPAVQAQTTVNSAVTANTRWSLAGSPYVVSGDVVIQGGAQLTIEPGVVVSMAAGARLTVQAGGIQAIGTVDQPIQVISDKQRQGATPAAGDWDQWVFSSGTANTRLERVTFLHGRGLRVEGSAPVFNYLDIRQQQGAAIAVDLAASPSGVGNRASGNVINGISVPAGDVIGSVRWALRGIPYVVTSGVVSVGESPGVASVSPATLEQGQTVTVALNGTRLGGLNRLSSSHSGLTFTPFTGGSSAQVFAQVAVAANAPVGPADLQVLVEAGALSLPAAFTITQPLPAIVSLSPSTVLAGAGVTQITVNGRNFASNSTVLFNEGAVPTTFVSASQVLAALPSQSAVGTLSVKVSNPAAGGAGQPLLSNVASLTVEAPVPPGVSVEPTPIALPPDGKSRDITIRLSKADYRDNVLNFSISDVSKATVSPASVVVRAGQTTATATIVPKQAGTVSFIVESPTLQRVAVPLFITNDFSGVNTAYAPLVGVMVNAPLPGGTATRTAADAVVGVTVGSVVTQVAPRAWTKGSSNTLVIRGRALPAGAQVSVLPSTGVVVGSPVLNAEATELRVPVTAAVDAAVGARRLLVRDGANKEVLFADASQASVEVMNGLPSIRSITPIVVSRGDTVKVVVRGENLQRGRLQLTPESGLLADAAPVVSSDGTELSAWLQVSSDAVLGDRLLQVVAPAGATSAVMTEANRMTVVARSLGQTGPIAAPVVGVMVGKVEQTRTTHTATSLVGVLLGTGVNSVAPNIGVVGTTQTVTIRGAGLQLVSAVSMQPTAGVSVATPTVNESGTEMTVAVTVDSASALGARRLALTAANGLPVVFARPQDANFLISAPVPELIATEPQVLVSDGSTVRMNLRGRNLLNVVGARLEPSDGVTVTGPFNTNAEGTTLSFNISVAAGAGSGVRAVVVKSAAGESLATVQPGNLVRVAQRTAGSYASILSMPVGIQVGRGADTSSTYVDLISASPVGVQVGGAPPQETAPVQPASRPVGVAVGAFGASVSPSGWLQGSSGELLILGQGLDSVSAVVIEPATGLLVGAPVASADGSRLSVPLSVAPDAPLTARRLRLVTGTGAPVSFAMPDVPRIGIGAIPTLTSLSPIVLEQGKPAALVVRGAKLKGVLMVQFEPADGLEAGSGLVWSQDNLGELLTVPVNVARGAPLGQRVLRLVVPGGSTSASSTAANTITVVTPN